MILARFEIDARAPGYVVEVLAGGDIEELFAAQRGHALQVVDPVDLVVARIAHAAQDTELVAQLHGGIREGRDTVERGVLREDLGQRDRSDEHRIERQGVRAFDLLVVVEEADDPVDRAPW